MVTKPHVDCWKRGRNLGNRVMRFDVWVGELVDRLWVDSQISSLEKGNEYNVPGTDVIIRLRSMFDRRDGPVGGRTEGKQSWIPGDGKDRRDGGGRQNVAA
jgi:hypothetical protein